MKDLYLLYLITPANSLGSEGKYLLACYSDVHNLVKRMKNGIIVMVLRIQANIYIVY